MRHNTGFVGTLLIALTLGLLAAPLAAKALGLMPLPSVPSLADEVIE
jgi:hypothetical protein